VDKLFLLLKKKKKKEKKRKTTLKNKNVNKPVDNFNLIF